MPSSSEAKNPKVGWPPLKGLIYRYYLIWGGETKNEKQVVFVDSVQKSVMANNATLKGSPWWVPMANKMLMTSHSWL